MYVKNFESLPIYEPRINVDKIRERNMTNINSLPRRPELSRPQQDKYDISPGKYHPLLFDKEGHEDLVRKMNDAKNNAKNDVTYKSVLQGVHIPDVNLIQTFNLSLNNPNDCYDPEKYELDNLNSSINLYNSSNSISNIYPTITPKWFNNQTKAKSRIPKK
jgi:hypothetical protein